MRNGEVQAVDERQDLLREIDERIAGETGEDFFRALVLGLANAFGAASAFACEFNPNRTVAVVLAEWKSGAMLDELAPFDLVGTPCQLTLGGEIVAFGSRVSDQYPYLKELPAESYLAIPLKISGGSVVGHLAVVDTHERQWQAADFGILRIFAARAAAEIERRRFERELEAAKLAAEQANLAKSQFLAHMSHEIRTPLNAMFGYAQLLARDAGLSPSQREAVEQITLAGEHLLGLVSEVLDIAKIEAGRIDLNAESVDLERCIAHVVAVERLRIEGQGLRFDYQPPTTWPPRLLIDERKLRQILLNLLNNAAQFTARGSVSFSVAFNYAKEAQSYAVDLCVRDTGIGIAENEYARIFDPFYRTEAGWRMTSGSGLGLAIVRRLVSLMGGEITVASTVGEGSAFVVHLDLKEAVESVAERSPSVARIIGYEGRRRSVLIADDNQDNREVLGRLLKTLGFITIDARDGEDACACAIQALPDMIFMDLVMPGLDGFEAVRRLRATPVAAHTPIVALSASAFDDTARMSSVNGFNAFYSKPVRFEQIIDVLGRELGLVWIEAPADSLADSRALEGAPTHAAKEAGITPDELAELLDLAQLGDIAALGRTLDTLGSRSGVEPVLLVRLRELARRYDMKGIRELLRAVTP